jgi:hypothetical protein
MLFPFPERSMPKVKSFSPDPLWPPVYSAPLPCERTEHFQDLNRKPKPIPLTVKKVDGRKV